MTLRPVAEILDALGAAGLVHEVVGELPATITAFTDDSRRVCAGGAFAAVRGHAGDGHSYLAAATAAGMALALVEDATGLTVPAIVVRDSRRAVALAAAAAWGHPARSLRMVGVTGTSGKTTTVAMLRHLLDCPDHPAASIGTLGVLLGSVGEPLPGGAGLTTPGPVELQEVCRALVDRGVRWVAMETSSHALDQHRVDAVAFAGAVFTNLSRDHLDYHGSMAQYLAAKARLVALLAPDGVSAVNADAAEWRDLPPAPRVLRFGLQAGDAEVRAEALATGPEGSAWTLVAGGERVPVRLPLIGDFNVSNALGAAAVAMGLGLSPAVVAGRLSTLPQVPGRLERILTSPVVLRDYAHKPDALERALQAVRPFCPGKLIVVFGCGGDRDRGKRPIMGGIAERLAGVVILTSDNPRTEDPHQILAEIEAGMTPGRHERIEDRRAAIARALTLAGDGDVVILAGKGHETYQIRGTEKLPFDEAVITRELAGHT
ncbi:MAG: UDP-N-acetylmuramoyl-L-alanyl-D-glutamate--2,6-diaminopimelate ligase [Gemmatimonadetes bacterium]|nr:UDP-N-acetylmuramoyl-L-alanyl-D-glutamate--2,6-diaminopimelate ligase [Gemmatimonadota bacterium]